MRPAFSRGVPVRSWTRPNGYSSHNAKRVELRFDCGFTVDGELVAPDIGRYASVTAEDTVRFVRA